MLAGAAAARAQDPGMVAPADQSQDPGMIVPAPHDVDPGIAPSANWKPAPSYTIATRLEPGLPEAPVPQSQPYEPITGTQRVVWVVTETLGPADLALGVVVAGIGTATNSPHEYGPHWGGFGERYGIRLAGVATQATMEASFGAIWGEDPRYKREPEKSLGGRLRSVVVQTFMTRRRDGDFAPAYARFIAVPGSNFLSNTWRANSEADSYHAGIRTIEGFGIIMGANAWAEFWPSMKDRLFHKHAKPQRAGAGTSP